jgi:hypothetical protein
MTDSISTARSVLDAIESGEIDDYLRTIVRVANERIVTISPGTTPTPPIPPVSAVGLTIDDLGLGDSVRFNARCGTKYLIGATARVVGFKRTKVVVKIDKPKGRFARLTPDGVVSLDVTVSPVLLERV